LNPCIDSSEVMIGPNTSDTKYGRFGREGGVQECSTLETGQPALALPASSSNFTWPTPGMLPVGVRCTAAMVASPAACRPIGIIERPEK
jgi:hypothetical protein